MARADPAASAIHHLFHGKWRTLHQNPQLKGFAFLNPQFAFGQRRLEIAEVNALQ